jgi:hypothetical protein
MMGKTEGPHDEDGFYTCPCGTDRNGKPYNRRSVMHVHSKMMALAVVAWTHPKREVVEPLCKRHEAQVLNALMTLGLGCTGEKAPAGTACLRCAVEASGQEVRFAYGLAG